MMQVCALKALNLMVRGGFASSIVKPDCVSSVMKAWRLHLLRRFIQVGGGGGKKSTQGLLT